MLKNKKSLIAATVLVAAMILIASTFAWQQTANKVNEFIGKKEGFTGHDDFNGSTKDVYVENTGSNVIFVRVKLNEAMNLTNNTWRPSSGADWQTHVFGATKEDCGKSSASGNRFHDYFTWEMGGWKYYMPGDGSRQIVQDNTVYTGAEPGVKATHDGRIITIAEYLGYTAAQKQSYTGWIYDADGYAYWSQPLPAGEATGLLLHKVNTAASLKNTEYYYAIDVIFEAVNIDDIPMWTVGAVSADGSGKTSVQATANGRTALEIIASYVEF